MINVIDFFVNLCMNSAVILVALIGGYMIYDSTVVTRSAILGREILEYIDSEDGVDLSGLKVINSDIVG